MCFGRFDSENSDKKKIHPNLPMYGNCFAPKKNFPSLKFEIESYAKKQEELGKNEADFDKRDL